VNKKRNYDEALSGGINSDTDQIGFGSGPGTEGTLSTYKDQKNDLWIKKYVPFNIVSNLSMIISIFIFIGLTCNA